MSLDYGEPVPPVVVPTLRTRRLILTGWTAADIGPYTEMAARPDMSRYTGSPASEAAVWRMFAFQVGHWALRDYGMWLAHDRATGEFIGRIGLYEEHGWPGIEVAWTIRRDRWGEGLATEGGAAALEFAFDVVGRDRVISIIHPDNGPSIRVAEKLGLAFAEHRPDMHDGKPRDIYAISRAEWESRPAARRLTADEAAASTGPQPDEV
jgi:RimJ/RimL family protein N-acetyltransferase